MPQRQKAEQGREALPGPESKGPIHPQQGQLPKQSNSSQKYDLHCLFAPTKEAINYKAQLCVFFANNLDAVGGNKTVQGVLVLAEASKTPIIGLPVCQFGLRIQPIPRPGIC